MRYELSDIQLKRNKGFIEEDIVLAIGKLQNNYYDESRDRKRGKVESVLSFETNSFDYFGQGSFGFFYTFCAFNIRALFIPIILLCRLSDGQRSSYRYSSARIHENARMGNSVHASWYII